jgi:hypothetical protein
MTWRARAWPFDGMWAPGMNGLMTTRRASGRRRTCVRVRGITLGSRAQDPKRSRHPRACVSRGERTASALRRVRSFVRLLDREPDDGDPVLALRRSLVESNEAAAGRWDPIAASPGEPVRPSGESDRSCTPVRATGPLGWMGEGSTGQPDRSHPPAWRAAETPASMPSGVGVDSTVWSRWQRVITIRHLTGPPNNAGIAEAVTTQGPRGSRYVAHWAWRPDPCPLAQPWFEKVGMNR